MKKILLLTAILSVCSLNAQLMKAEPAKPVKIVTLQDVEIQKIKTDIKNHNDSQEEMIIKYDNVSYSTETKLFNVSNVKIYDKKEISTIPLRIGDVLFTSYENTRDIRFYVNNFKINKSELETILQEYKTEIDPDTQQTIDSIFMLIGKNELTIKLSTEIKAIEETQKVFLNQKIEIEDFGKISFNINAIEVDKMLFKDNFTEAQTEKLFEIKISDLDLSLETSFYLGKLRSMISENNYKDIINSQIVELAKDNNTVLYKKELEIKTLEAIRDNKNIIIKIGMKKDFTIRDIMNNAIIGVMSPEFAISIFDIYIKTELKD
jgi:hypothetical protein